MDDSRGWTTFGAIYCSLAQIASIKKTRLSGEEILAGSHGKPFDTTETR
jgi:hypothetical protein